jgi:hypothetical protein
MTRQQNRGIWLCIILCSLLELMAIIGAYAASNFTKTRMGMLRHVAYLNGKWEQAVPVSSIRWIAVCTIIALAILAYLHYRKQKAHFRFGVIVMLWTFGLSAWTLYYLLFYNVEMNRAYYIMSICFILGTVLQNILHHCFFSKKGQISF